MGIDPNRKSAIGGRCGFVRWTEPVRDRIKNGSGFFFCKSMAGQAEVFRKSLDRTSFDVIYWYHLREVLFLCPF